MCLGEITEVVELTEEMEVYKVFKHEEMFTPFGEVYRGLSRVYWGKEEVIPMHLWINEVDWREYFSQNVIQIIPGEIRYDTGWHCFVNLGDARKVVSKLDGFDYVVVKALVKGKVTFGADGVGGALPGAKVVVSKLMNVLEIIGDKQIARDVTDGTIQTSEEMGRREAVVV